MKRELKKLLESRSQKAAQMRALHELAEKESRALTEDEQATWEKLDVEIDEEGVRIERLRKIEEIEGITEDVELGEEEGPSGLRVAPQFKGREKRNAQGMPEKEYRAAFGKFLRFGHGGLSQEERTILQRRVDQSPETRAAFSTSPGAAGGYTIPQEFRRQLEIALKEYGGMMDAAEIMPTDTGAQLSMPSWNTTGVKASIVGENVQSVKYDGEPYSNVTLGAFTYRTPVLALSYEFLQDSAFGEGYIIDAMRDFIGRALNDHFTNGTGTGQPRGILADAVSGKVGAAGSAASITFDDLFDLEHSIDPAYRRLGARFMMHDQTFKVVKKIKDANGRYIYLPGYDGMAGSVADTILGHPVTINQDMPQMEANAKSILFGVLSKYKVRMVRDVTLLRLMERYADFLQVGFLMFLRADGRLLDAGTNPVKFYQNGAS